MATNTSSPKQEANFLEEDDDSGSDEEADNANVPESDGQDTGVYYGNATERNIQPQDELETIPEEEEPLQGPFSCNCAKVLTSIFARFSCLFLLVLCINKYIAQLWGMLQECTLGSSRVLCFYQHKIYNYNTCSCCTS